MRNDDFNEEYIRVKAIPKVVLYPKAPAVLGENEIGKNYGIVSWTVKAVETGKPALTKYGTISVKGQYDAGVDNGVCYTLFAKRLPDTDYGPEYNLTYYGRKVDFSTVRNQRRFLSSFLTPNQVESLLKTCPNPLEAMEKHDIEALKKAKGIGTHTAELIIRKFENSKDKSEVYLALDKASLTQAFIDKLIEHYNNPAVVVSIINKNPYRLIQDVDGVGFKTADKIAMSTGYSPSDPRRIEAYILWRLAEEGDNGNSYINLRELTSAIYTDLGEKEEVLEVYENPEEHEGEPNNLALAMKHLNDKDLVVTENDENIPKADRKVYLKKIWLLEREIAYHLKRLMDCEDTFVVEDVDEKIELAERRQGFKFTQEQKDGIKLGLKSQVCLISGLAGTGKTSLVSGILTILSDYSFAQTSLSGKAAARMQEVTGVPGKTIHRLLGYSPMGFAHNEEEPLEEDIIILDEVSMVGGEIFLSLLKAIKNGAKLYMLGDLGQLEAVGLLNLAADMYNSEAIPMVELTQVHRQAKASGILTTAYDVRNHVQVFDDREYQGTIVTGEKKDMIIDASPERTEALERAMYYYKKSYVGRIVNQDVDGIEIISPVKERGTCSVYSFNQEIQAYINPPHPKKLDILIRKNRNEGDFSYYLREGDKVMCVKNNYAFENESGQPVEMFNGWTGKIVRIWGALSGTTNEDGKYDFLVEEAVKDKCYNLQAKKFTQSYGWVYVFFPLAQDTIKIPMSDVSAYLTLGYACTCHKMQGSAADVIICLANWETPPNMLTSQLVYTMLTRAKKRCILVCQSPALKKAIETDAVSTKRTFLKEFLNEKYEKLRAEHNKRKYGYNVTKRGSQISPEEAYEEPVEETEAEETEVEETESEETEEVFLSQI